MHLVLSSVTHSPVEFCSHVYYIYRILLNECAYSETCSLPSIECDLIAEQNHAVSSLGPVRGLHGLLGLQFQSVLIMFHMIL